MTKLFMRHEKSNTLDKVTPFMQRHSITIGMARREVKYNRIIEYVKQKKLMVINSTDSSDKTVDTKNLVFIGEKMKWKEILLKV